MRATFALLFKFTATLGAAWIAFGVFDSNPFTWVLVVALACTVINYTLGDLVILQYKGNIIASIGYGVLGAASAYLIDLFPINFITSITELIVFSVIVMFIEYFYRIYLLKNEKVTTNDFHREPPIEF